MVSNRLVVTTVAVFAASSLLMSIVLILLQLDARAQRANIQRQNDFVVCILQTQASKRTDATLQKCKTENGIK